MSTSPFKSPEEMVEDAYFDTDFSIDISQKMTVPNKIKAVEGSYTELLDDPAILAFDPPKMNSDTMQVPECIRVAGGEAHITTHREPPLEIKLEDRLFGKPLDDPIQLSTPPRTLRYQDAAPIFAEPIKQLDKALNSSSNMINTMDGSILRMANNDTTLIDFEDNEMISTQNFTQLRRRILQLSRRIDSLEIENRHRNKRDVIIYALGALYLLFRGLSWLASSGGGRNRFTL